MFDQPLSEGQSQALNVAWHNELSERLRKAAATSNPDLRLSTPRLLVKRSGGSMPSGVVLSMASTRGDFVEIELAGPGQLETDTGDVVADGEVLRISPSAIGHYRWTQAGWDAGVTGVTLPSAALLTARIYRVTTTTTDDPVEYSDDLPGSDVEGTRRLVISEGVVYEMTSEGYEPAATSTQLYGSSKKVVLLERAYDPEYAAGVHLRVEPRTAVVAYNGPRRVDFDDLSSFPASETVVARSVEATYADGSPLVVSSTGQASTLAQFSARRQFYVELTRAEAFTLTITYTYGAQTRTIHREVPVVVPPSPAHLSGGPPTLPSSVRVEPGYGSFTIVVGSTCEAGNIEDLGAISSEDAEALVAAAQSPARLRGRTAYALAAAADILALSASALSARRYRMTLTFPTGSFEPQVGEFMVHSSGMVLRIESVSGGAFPAIYSVEAVGAAGFGDTVPLSLTGIEIVSGADTLSLSGTMLYKNGTAVLESHSFSETIEPLGGQARVLRMLPKAATTVVGAEWSVALSLRASWDRGETTTAAYGPFDCEDLESGEPLAVTYDSGTLRLSRAAFGGYVWASASNAQPQQPRLTTLAETMATGAARDAALVVWAGAQSPSGAVASVSRYNFDVAAEAGSLPGSVIHRTGTASGPPSNADAPVSGMVLYTSPSGDMYVGFGGQWRTLAVDSAAVSAVYYRAGSSATRSEATRVGRDRYEIRVPAGVRTSALQIETALAAGVRGARFSSSRDVSNYGVTPLFDAATSVFSFFVPASAFGTNDAPYSGTRLYDLDLDTVGSGRVLGQIALIVEGVAPAAGTPSVSTLTLENAGNGTLYNITRTSDSTATVSVDAANGSVLRLTAMIAGASSALITHKAGVTLSPAVGTFQGGLFVGTFTYTGGSSYTLTIVNEADASVSTLTLSIIAS